MNNLINETYIFDYLGKNNENKGDLRSTVGVERFTYIEAKNLRQRPVDIHVGGQYSLTKTEI